MPEYYLNTLPSNQRKFWKYLTQVPGHFVLYGGTAIALRLGHRTSIDFDFFSNESFIASRLFQDIDFLKHGNAIQNEENTLTVLVPVGDNSIKVSFFGNLGLNQIANPSKMDNGISMASMIDLFGIKCATIPQRVESKDYIDIYSIIEQTEFALDDGLAAAKAIYGSQYNPVFTLKALSYFGNEELKSLDDRIKKMLTDQVIQSKGDKVIKATDGIGFIEEEKNTNDT